MRDPCLRRIHQLSKLGTYHQGEQGTDVNVDITNLTYEPETDHWLLLKINISKLIVMTARTSVMW